MRNEHQTNKLALLTQHLQGKYDWYKAIQEKKYFFFSFVNVIKTNKRTENIIKIVNKVPCTVIRKGIIIVYSSQEKRTYHVTN